VCTEALALVEAIKALDFKGVWKIFQPGCTLGVNDCLDDDRNTPLSEFVNLFGFLVVHKRDSMFCFVSVYASKMGCFPVLQVQTH
jgi:hypothetical protein